MIVQTFTIFVVLCIVHCNLLENESISKKTASILIAEFLSIWYTSKCG